MKAAPSPLAWAIRGPRNGGVEPFVSRYTDRCWWYGSAKAALADGIAAVADPGETVLLPAYVPDAVPEPFLERGLRPEFYALRCDLSPDFDDLRTRLDDDTAAVVTVDYFGFPQPGRAALTDLAAAADCALVDDDAHAPFSVHDGRLLGTAGDLGVTSIRKTLPVPDGGLLYLDDELAAAFDPGPLAGAADRLDRRDIGYLARSLGVDLRERSTVAKRAIDALVPGDPEAATVPRPRVRYQAATRRCSALTRRIAASADPEAIRARRRANYLAWLEGLAERADLEPIYPDLPPGICPQVFPVVADEPQKLAAELADAGVAGVHTWPRLRSTVADDPAYETARFLATRVLVLPVHQQVSPAEIRSVCRSLDERAASPSTDAAVTRSVLR